MTTETYVVDPFNAMSLKNLIKSLKNTSKSVVIFPEGALTRTGQLQQAFPGCYHIANKTGLPIVPIYLEGLMFSKATCITSFFAKTKLIPPTTITIGEHFYCNETGVSKEKACQIIYDKITACAMGNQNLPPDMLSFLNSMYYYGKNKGIMHDVTSIYNPITYKEIWLRTCVLSKLLEKYNITDKRVGMIMPNSVATASLILACQKNNLTPVILNYTSGITPIIQNCETANVKNLIVSRKLLATQKLNNIEELLPEGLTIHYIEDWKKEITTVDKLNAYVDHLFSSSYKRAIRDKSQHKKEAVILFTSGTEGMAKAVVLSHENILANVRQVQISNDFNPNDKLFNCLPMFHCFGLTVGTFMPMLSGITSFNYVSPLDYRNIPQLIYDFHPTLFISTNTFLKGYAKYASSFDLKSLRFVAAGAEALEQSTIDLWQDKFLINVVSGYGTTEASPGISLNNKMFHKKGTVGRLLPGMSYKLIKHHENDGDDTGELVIKGPNIMLGYIHHDNPKKIAEPKDGWYATGDIVKVDEDGFITILDRRKRFAKIAGEMVSLGSVEQYAKQFDIEKRTRRSNL